MQWLGVDCLWLPPFYDSPLRDGGYDIRDFAKVLPEFGTVDDFVALLDAAHQRGHRIITDLVMNHVGLHPGFRSARPDSLYGDFYVWSDTSQRYTDARIIFIDTESLNWTLIRCAAVLLAPLLLPPAGPELDNPAVQEAMIDVLRFWLDLGIDSFRLDARTLPVRGRHQLREPAETHAFLKHCRKVIDDEYPPGAAGQGQPVAGRCRRNASATRLPGDRCHMAFHFR
ncbi:MAG: hypothetical protein H6522_12760 [Mycolicibacterium sp.]|nr:hypothetical protein [Mycolicibacterium sp.]